MSLLLRWIFGALSLVAVTYLVPGIAVANFYAALWAALMLGLVNALVRPILIVFTLPVNILTLGFFTLVINALLFWFVSSVVKGFSVAGFWPAFWGALITWLISWTLNGIFNR